MWSYCCWFGRPETEIWEGDKLISSSIRCSCGYGNSLEAIFCVKCGKLLKDNAKIKCPSCGIQADVKANFCEKCGAELKQ